MTYNVRYFGHGTRGLWSTAWAMNGIAKAIAELDPLPDIVCLQEVETWSVRANVGHWRRHRDDTQLTRLMTALHGALAQHGKPDAYAAHYFPAHAYRLTKATNFYTTGLAILAHQGTVIAHHNAEQPFDITHRGERPSSWKQTRISAHVRFTHRSGDSIDVFNTHLSLPVSFTKQFWGKDRMGFGENQRREADKLATFIAAEAASDRYLVVGDFNTLPGSPVYQYLTEERGWVDAFGQCVADGDIERCRKWATAGFMHLRMHLDHVFAGPGIEWIDFADSHPFGHKLGRFHGLSDHVPLIARCRVKTTAPRSSERSSGLKPGSR